MYVRLVCVRTLDLSRGRCMGVIPYGGSFYVLAVGRGAGSPTSDNFCYGFSSPLRAANRQGCKTRPHRAFGKGGNIEMIRIYRRKIDDLRRVVIPQQMLNGINVKPGDLVDITCEGGSVRIEKSMPICWLCRSDENLVEVEVEEQNCMICSRCVMRIQMALLRRQRRLKSTTLLRRPKRPPKKQHSKKQSRKKQKNNPQAKGPPVQHRRPVFCCVAVMSTCPQMET